MRNLEVLYPVFPTVALVLKSVLPNLTKSAQEEVFSAFRTLITAGSYVTLVPTNLAYAVRVIALDPTEDATKVLAHIYTEPRANVLVKRDVILAMAKKKVKFWLSDLIKKFDLTSSWEKSALVVASFALGDEGHHWRRHTVPRLNAVDADFAKWVASKNNGRQWEIPL